jgi:ADP-heptose:LPS heptosyltransferase
MTVDALDNSISLGITQRSSFVASRFWRVLPAGMRKRWWLFRCFDLLVRYWPRLRRSKGILIVRMDGVGDMVLFRRTLDEYAKIFSVNKENITVLGCDSWGTVAPTIFQGYRFLSINEHAFARRPLYRFRVGFMVRKIAPAVTICDSYLRRAMMADSLVWMARAPKSISSLPFINEKTRPEFTYYLSQVDQIIDTGPYPTHEILRHYRFISELAGRKIKPKPPKILWRNKKPIILGLKNGGIPYVVLNPGSNEFGRRWPFENYLKIANNIVQAGHRVVIVGGSEERPNNYKDHISSNADIIDLIGKTTLAQLLDVLKHAACVISNDTGPAHLSIALETPTVVIVGGGHFGSFVPYPEQLKLPFVRFIYKKMPCYHCFWRCHLRETKFEAFPCISYVEVENVWHSVKQLLTLKINSIV